MNTAGINFVEALLHLQHRMILLKQMESGSLPISRWKEEEQERIKKRLADYEFAVRKAEDEFHTAFGRMMASNDPNW